MQVHCHSSNPVHHLQQVHHHSSSCDCHACCAVHVAHLLLLRLILINWCARNHTHIDWVNSNRFSFANKQYTELVIVCANNDSLLMIKALGSKSEKSNIAPNILKTCLDQHVEHHDVPPLPRTMASWQRAHKYTGSMPLSDELSSDCVSLRMALLADDLYCTPSDGTYIMHLAGSRW